MAVVIQPKLNPGDVVRLKSGSPAMTVGSISNRIDKQDRRTVCGHYIKCTWFVDGAMHAGTFDADALTIDEKGSKQ